MDLSDPETRKKFPLSPAKSPLFFRDTRETEIHRSNVAVAPKGSSTPLLRAPEPGYGPDPVKFASENPSSPIFPDDILSRYAGLKGAKIWKEEHDLVLLHAVLMHGYGSWKAIVDDKDLNIQNVICQELNIPFINLPFQGQVGSPLQNGANMTNVGSTYSQSGENGTSKITADGANVTNVQSACNPPRENSASGMAVEGAQGSSDARNQEQVCQESSILCQFREMQRRQIDYIKKRVSLLEKCLNDEYQKEYYRDMKANEVTNEELKSEPKATNVKSCILGETHTQMIGQLPQLEAITPEEICTFACDNDPNRLRLPHLYNEMCSVMEDSAPTSLDRELTEVNAMKNAHQLETIYKDINRILAPEDEPTSEPIVNSDSKPDVISPSLPETRN